MDYNTSSTSIEPNSPFQDTRIHPTGKDVENLSKELDFKLKMAKRKRLANKHLISTTTSSALKNSVQKNKKMSERNKTLTLDDEEQPCLPRSVSFDSKDSRMCVDDSHDDINNSLFLESQLQPYDPIKNYLSPRPQYLKFNPNRHREIFARQKNVSRVTRSASYDAGMCFPKEELESSVDCSLGVSSRENSVEGTDIIAPEHEDEYEEVKEEVFEEGNGWKWKVFVQYLIVIIALILTTLAITSMNSPKYSHGREAIQGYLNLYKKSYCSIFRNVGFDFSKLGKMIKGEIDVKHDEVWKKDVGDDKTESKQLEGYKTEEIKEVQEFQIDEYHDEMWNKDDTGQVEEKEETSYGLHEHAILKSEEVYSDFDGGEVSEELEVLEMMVEEEDVGKEDGNNIGLDENILSKLARFDPVFTAFIGVCVLILVSLSKIYYSKKLKISPTNNTKNVESFINSSPLTSKTTHSGSFIDLDAVSSSEEKSSYMEFSTDSPSYGSFTVEKKIVKKKKSKQPEVMLSPVRRSSRIHNRSFTSP